jgi:hypothetical protein
MKFAIFVDPEDAGKDRKLLRLAFVKPQEPYEFELMPAIRTGIPDGIQAK